MTLFHLATALPPIPTLPSLPVPNPPPLPISLPPLPNPPISIAPITDLVYTHLPGGSFFGFVGTLPGSGQVIGLLLSLPGGSQFAQFLGQLGVFG
jgi:hypothetical protein